MAKALTSTKQCGHRVTHIVHHPHFEGDLYCVCAKHIEWARHELAPRKLPILVRVTAKWEVATNCVYGLTRGDGTRTPMRFAE